MHVEKIVIVTSHLKKEAGGIQYWCFQIADLFKRYGFRMAGYGLRELSFRDGLGLIRDCWVGDRLIFGTWKHMLPMLPVLIIKRLLPPGVSRQKIEVLCHGDEYLVFKVCALPVLLKLVFFTLRVSLTANSQYTAALVEERLSVTGVRVVRPIVASYNLTATSEFREGPEKLKNKINLLTISRLVPRKNIQTCIRAVLELRALGLDVTYSIAGKGPELKKLRALAFDLGLQDSIRFLGKITEEKKNLLLSRADIFLLPSLQTTSPPSVEGYGIVFIEANYHGCPVISGNTGGMPEAVKNGITGIVTDGSLSNVLSAVLYITRKGLDSKKIIAWAKVHNAETNKKLLMDYGITR